MTPRLAIQPKSDGTKTRRRYVRGLARIAPPSFASSHHLTIRTQSRRVTRKIRYPAASRRMTVAHGCSCTNANLMSNEHPWATVILLLAAGYLIFLDTRRLWVQIGRAHV